MVDPCRVAGLGVGLVVGSGVTDPKCRCIRVEAGHAGIKRRPWLSSRTHLFVQLMLGLVSATRCR